MASRTKPYPATQHLEGEMAEIVTCKHCGNPEYYGEMRWLNGKEECRPCYKAHWEEVNHKHYAWDDLGV